MITKDLFIFTSLVCSIKNIPNLLILSLTHLREREREKHREREIRKVVNKSNFQIFILLLDIIFDESSRMGQKLDTIDEYEGVRHQERERERERKVEERKREKWKKEREGERRKNFG